MDALSDWQDAANAASSALATADARTARVLIIVGALVAFFWQRAGLVAGAIRAPPCAKPSRPPAAWPGTTSRSPSTRTARTRLAAC